MLILPQLRPDIANMLMQALNIAIQKALTEQYGLGKVSINLEKTPRDHSGDYTLVVFPLLKYTKTNPQQTAKSIGDALIRSCDLIEK